MLEAVNAVGVAVGDLRKALEQPLDGTLGLAMLFDEFGEPFAVENISLLQKAVAKLGSVGRGAEVIDDPKGRGARVASVADNSAKRLASGRASTSCPCHTTRSKNQSTSSLPA